MRLQIKNKIKLIRDKKQKSIINNFTKKQKKILKQINEGKCSDIYFVNFSAKEYLYKDSEGITFLEHLLKNHIFYDKDKLKNSLEAAYIYCKCGKYLFNFSLTEEQLFSEINGVRFIDFIIQNDVLTGNIVNSIKNNVEIIDILVTSSKGYYLYEISNELKEKLIIPDSNGKYFIEKYFNDKYIIKKLIPLIDDVKLLIKLCEKYNREDLLEYVNADVLMFNIDKNYSFLDYLLNKNIEPDCLFQIPNNKKFVNYLINKKMYKYLANADESILLIKVDNKKTLLEEIIEKEDIKRIKGYIENKKTIQILHEHNKLNIQLTIKEELLMKPVSDVLNIKIKNKTLLEYMLDNEYNVSINSGIINNKSIIKTLYDRKEYKILGESINESNLLLQMDDGVCLVDKLLDNNIKICYRGFKSKELIKKFYERNRIDLVANSKFNILLGLRNKDGTYFDTVLKNIKSQNIKFNLNDIDFIFCKDVNLIAIFYLKIAKHDMMIYVKELEKEDLLKEYNGKTLLKELLDLDTNLTISKVINDKVKSELEIALILKSRGLEQKDIDVPIENKEFAKEYLDNFNNSLGIGPMLYEADILLNKLSDLFYNDNKSDPKLIDALISGYRHSLLVNYEYYINELRNLVNIKEKNKYKFVYLKEENKAFFRPIDGTVHSDNNVVETILHETGHALHSYLVKRKIPKDYVDIVKKARENPETLKNVEEFSKRYNQIKNETSKLIDEKYELYFKDYYNDEKKQEINKFLQKSLLEKKEEFKNLGISEDNLDIILEKNFTVDEYINHQKRVFINENMDAIFRSEFGSYMAIADILDAIYEGQLHSGILKNNNGEEIPHTAGHGVAYYYDNPSSGFSEMVANFASICKSKDSREMLILLKSIVGKELFDMINGFYYRNIIINEEDRLEETKIL